MMEKDRPPHLLAMMAGLAQLGALGFGGVGPQALHFFVERRRWLTIDDYAELTSIAQALPGANIVNLCAILGDRWFGPVGAAGAVAAIVLPPLAIVLVAAGAIAHLTRSPRFVTIECEIVTASAGLILANAVRVARTIVRRRIVALGVVAAIVAAIGWHLASMPVVTIGGIALGLGLDLGLDRAAKRPA